LYDTVQYKRKKGDMKKWMLLILALFVTILSGESWCKPVGEYIGEAKTKNQSGDIDAAARIMQEALKEYPDNPTIMGYLGGYIGRRRGKPSNRAT